MESLGFGGRKMRMESWVAWRKEDENGVLNFLGMKGRVEFWFQKNRVEEAKEELGPELRERKNQYTEAWIKDMECSS